MRIQNSRECLCVCMYVYFATNYVNNARDECEMIDCGLLYNSASTTNAKQFFFCLVRERKKSRMRVRVTPDPVCVYVLFMVL